MSDPIIVSYSELDTFRQCPLKHFLAYKQRYQKPPKPDSALAKGSLYHLVMEAHYRAIKAAQDEFLPSGRIPLQAEKGLLADIYENHVHPILWDSTKGEWFSDVHELVDWMYKGYVEKYGIDRQWKIMGVEHHIQTPLRDARGRRTRYHIKAKIDLLVMDRSSGKLWVIDHKSGQNLPTQMDLEIDDQFGLYTWMMREMGRKVQGSIHSANRTQRNKSPMSLDSRMSRTFLHRSDKELTNLALDAYHAARAAWPPKSMETARYSSPDPRTCGWKCDFKEAHIAMRKGSKPAQALRDFGFVINRTRH